MSTSWAFRFSRVRMNSSPNWSRHVDLFVTKSAWNVLSSTIPLSTRLFADSIFSWYDNRKLWWENRNKSGSHRNIPCFINDCRKHNVQNDKPRHWQQPQVDFFIYYTERHRNRFAWLSHAAYFAKMYSCENTIWNQQESYRKFCPTLYFRHIFFLQKDGNSIAFTAGKTVFKVFNVQLKQCMLVLAQMWAVPQCFEKTYSVFWKITTALGLWGGWKQVTNGQSTHELRLTSIPWMSHRRHFLAGGQLGGSNRRGASSLLQLQSWALIGFGIIIPHWVWPAAVGVASSKMHLNKLSKGHNACAVDTLVFKY